MFEFKWRGRKYTEKDIMIWILVAVSLFAIGYTHGLEKWVEDLDFNLQQCQDKCEPHQQQASYQPPTMPDLNFTNVLNCKYIDGKQIC